MRAWVARAVSIRPASMKGVTARLISVRPMSAIARAAIGSMSRWAKRRQMASELLPHSRLLWPI